MSEGGSFDNAVQMLTKYMNNDCNAKLDVPVVKQSFF